MFWRVGCKEPGTAWGPKTAARHALIATLTISVFLAPLQVSGLNTGASQLGRGGILIWRRPGCRGGRSRCGAPCGYAHSQLRVCPLQLALLTAF